MSKRYTSADHKFTARHQNIAPSATLRGQQERSGLRMANGERYRNAEAKRAQLTTSRRQARTAKVTARIIAGGAK